MSETLGAPSHEILLNESEISRREKDFNRVLRRLSPEQQDVITELTSVLMEGDIYRQYKGNLGKIEDLSMSLGLVGLKTSQRRVVLRYLNLS